MEDCLRKIGYMNEVTRLGTVAVELKELATHGLLAELGNNGLLASGAIYTNITEPPRNRLDAKTVKVGRKTTLTRKLGGTIGRC